MKVKTAYQQVRFQTYFTHIEKQRKQVRKALIQ